MAEAPTTNDVAGTSAFPAALLDIGLVVEDEQHKIRRAADLIDQGRAADAVRLVDRLMNENAGRTRPDVLLLHARYLLARSRPFSAGRALRPLLRRKPIDSRARLLYAEALADSGNVERAQGLAEKLANSGGPAAVDAARLYADLDRLARGREHPGAEVLEERLEEMTTHDAGKLFGPNALPIVDRLIREWIETGHLAHANSAETWGYYLGEYCCRHLGARWAWRRRIDESTVRVPLASGALELTPSVWARWRLSHPHHRFSDVVRTLLLLKGARHDQVEQVLGPNSAEHDVVPDPHGDPLSAALAEARLRSEQAQPVNGLGLAIDCPFGRVRVPLVVEEAGSPVLVLRSCEGGTEGDFERYLDMLCLGPFGRIRWSITTTDASHRLYEQADAGRRAALVARRMCTDDNGANARWAVALAGILLDTTLDGRLSSLARVERLIIEELRQGGRERWEGVFDDRYSVVQLLTAYAGEVVCRHYGGRWGADRITGEPTGPTAGLELGRVRFNLGALVLKSFYGGPGRSFLPAIREYARRAQIESGVDPARRVEAEGIHN